MKALKNRIRALF
jgi:hypothetical protein